MALRMASGILGMPKYLLSNFSDFFVNKFEIAALFLTEHYSFV